MSNSRPSKTEMSSLLHTGAYFQNPLDTVKAFSDYFSNRVRKLNNKFPVSNIDPVFYLQKDFPGSMIVPAINEKEAIKAIKSLNN